MDQYFEAIIRKHTAGIMPNQPRLLDQSVKYKWFNEIFQDVASGKTDAKIGIASVHHAESVGYILASDKTEFVSKLYPFEKKTISRGHVILVGNESNYDAIRRMLGFAVVTSPANVPKYEEFMDLLDDPPDDLAMPDLRWQVELWIAGIVASLYHLQVGWKDGHLVIDDGGFDGDED